MRRSLLPALLAPTLLAPSLAVSPTFAQQQGGGQGINTPQQQRVLDEGTGAPARSTVLDATNPIDLMNRIRRATAMDDATPPGDAVDAALRDFNAQPAAGSGQMKAP